MDKKIEKLIIDLTTLYNGYSIIHYINHEDKRIIFCLSEWSLIDGIFSEDKWEYHTFEVDKKTKSHLHFLVNDLIETYPNYSINQLKVE